MKRYGLLPLVCVWIAHGCVGDLMTSLCVCVCVCVRDWCSLCSLSHLCLGAAVAHRCVCVKEYGDPYSELVLCIYPSKVHTHSSEHTHTPWTHTRSSGQPFMLRRLGSSWGFGALLKGSSVVVLKVERALDIHSPHLQSLPDRDSNSQPFNYESDSLIIRPLLPLKQSQHSSGNVSGHGKTFTTPERLVWPIPKATWKDNVLKQFMNHSLIDLNLYLQSSLGKHASKAVVCCTKPVNSRKVMWPSVLSIWEWVWPLECPGPEARVSARLKGVMLKPCPSLRLF